MRCIHVLVASDVMLQYSSYLLPSLHLFSCELMMVIMRVFILDNTIHLHVLSTLWADDVILSSEEASSHQGNITAVAAKTVRMPVPVIKGDKLSTSKACNWFNAADTLLSKQFSKAVSTVRSIFTRCKLLSSQDTLTVSACEAVSVEGVRLVCDSTLVDHSIAFETTLCECILITRHADVFILTRDEALVSNRLFAHCTAETFFMPLFSTEFKLLHSSSEDVSTSVTSCSKVVIMAVSTVQALLLAGEGLIYQGMLAVTALEAHLMPMLLLVGQIL